MIPTNFQEWLDKKDWKIRPYQKEMLEAYDIYQNILIVAPPGAGKTFAAFLPIYLSLMKNNKFKGIHTLYISPLRSLTYDISRNIQQPIDEINLAIDVAVRTGDTSAYERQKQNIKPPHIFLITPESLALILSYPKLLNNFKNLQAIIIDEIHVFVASKRGDHLSLLMAKLYQIAPQAKRIGLSATVRDLKAVAKWLEIKTPAHIINFKEIMPLHVEILYSLYPLPLVGYFPNKHIIKMLYEIILDHTSNIIFVNTRVQAERLLQSLWNINVDNLPITLHHGSLSKEQRLKVEEGMIKGKLRAIVATSSLELGIDWGNVDMVINLGAPKGISRLLQRIGRSNHSLEKQSKAFLVPNNCFEALECEAALEALQLKVLDDAPPNSKGSLDILAQHIMSCACASSINPFDLYCEVQKAYPYHYLTFESFKNIFEFVINGGYVLQHYDNFHKLILDENNLYKPTNNHIQKIHRLNIGTIVGNDKLKVMLVTAKGSGKRKRGKGTLLGEIEEKFILNLKEGDTFLFGGYNLSFIEINGIAAEVSLAKKTPIKVPPFVGGSMPLSTHLSKIMAQVIETALENINFPSYIHTWLQTQQKISCLPQNSQLLVELFEHDKLHYLTVYTFQGRPINQALGFLLTYRLEEMGVAPLGFAITDYGISIRCIHPFSTLNLNTLWDLKLCINSYNHWLESSSMLKRYFKNTAIVSGLIYKKYPGQIKNGKQVLFNTDIIYDVLQKYEPNHIILQSNKIEAEKDLVNIERLKEFLSYAQNKIHYQFCKSITPFSIPIIVQSLSESLNNDAKDLLLEMNFLQNKANLLYDEISVD